MKLKLMAILFILSLPFKPAARAQQLELPGASLPTEFLNLFPELENQPLSLVPDAALPKAGTFWHLPAPGQMQQPPYPCPPQEMEHPIYAGPGNLFFVDESVTLKTTRTKLVQQPPPPGGGGNGTNIPPRPNIANPAKYGAQVFSRLDTNFVAVNDSNLYHLLTTGFPAAGAGPCLQIKLYGNSCVVIKANHFNYSQETRDFALLICDNPATPIWKSINLTGQNTNDGWLIAGTVPNYKVTDPMFMMISNISSWPAVLRAVPYSGPVIQLTGYPQYAVVNNSISLNTSVTDLSGVTNEQFRVTADGLPARSSFAAGNTINLDTRYCPNGLHTVYLQTVNFGARIYDPATPPDTQPTTFQATGSLPLDFENAACVVSSGDMTSPDVGTNHMLFYVNKAQQVACSIYNPTNGQVMASFGGYVPQAANVDIAWNFTMADRITPYGGDKYVVQFTAYDPATLTNTNTVDRVGVRAGAGAVLTYQWEDPSYHNPEGSWLNNQADTWIKNTLASLYQNLYSSTSLTQYQPWMVGANRNVGDCYQRDSYSPGYDFILNHLTNAARYSDFTQGPAHGSGGVIGGGFINDHYSALDLKRYVQSGGGKNWRLRKAAFWPCLTGRLDLSSASGFYNTDWADACGIRPNPLEETTYMRKNCGLFFVNEINQYGFAGGDTSISTAKVAATFDQAWICGANQFPGGCDPTYSFAWAINTVRGMFNPELDFAGPVLGGYSRMIYTSVYDDLLMVNNTSFVHP